MVMIKGMTYSLDFRCKVLFVRQKEGLTIEEVAKRFGIGKMSVLRWTKRLISKEKRNKPALKIDREALRKDVEAYPDAYYYERAKRLKASPTGIRDALKRLEITFKKKLFIIPRPKKENGLLFAKRFKLIKKRIKPLFTLMSQAFLMI